MPRLLLVRHGLTDWNAEGRIQGHTQTALNSVGQRQVEALGQRLADSRIDAIYASDLDRTLDTAAAIVQHHEHLTVNPDPRLREADYGEWEGRTMDELRRIYPETASGWLSEPVTVAPTGGESLEQVAERLASLLDELRQHADDEQIVLVSHGGAVRALLCLALNVPQGYSRRFRVDTASLSIIDITNGRTRVSLLNDRHHLADIGGVDLFIAF